MKTIAILAMTAVMMLAGCSSKEAENQETIKDEAASLTVTEASGTTTEKASKTTAKTTASATTATQTTTEVTTYKVDIPEAEEKALSKLNEKYGKDFTCIGRDVEWEFLDKPIPEKKPTTYILVDDDGRRFYAYGTEDSEEISGDNYAFPLFKDELLEHAKDYIRSYTKAGKLWMWYATEKMMPFEAPAELTYEDFFSYFCKQEGKVFAHIILPDGSELPEELTSFEVSNIIHLNDFGCQIVLRVYYMPQQKYDKLEDEMYGDIYINRDHMKEANEIY